MTRAVGVLPAGIVIASVLLPGFASAESSSNSACAKILGLLDAVCATVNVEVGPLQSCQPSQGIDVKCRYTVRFWGSASGLGPGSASFQAGCQGSWIGPFPSPDPCSTNPHTCSWANAFGSCSYDSGTVTYWLNASDGTLQRNCHDTFVSARSQLVITLGTVTVDSGEVCTPFVQG